LGAASRLARRGCFDVTVVERNTLVGGNAGSFDVAGLRVDFGSHRLHPSCAPEILNDIRAMLGDGLLDRPRHGRIRIRGRWVHFPLKPIDLAAHLPPSFLAGVLSDSVRKLRRRTAPADTFAGVLEHGLGRTICRDFYFPYASKIWGLPPSELEAEQARRRVSAGSLGKMVRKALNAVPGLKKNGAGRFYYPAEGFGKIAEAYHEAAIAAGARVLLRTEIKRLEIDAEGTVRVNIAGPGGDETLRSRQLLSTIPLSALVRLIDPAPPKTVLNSASALRFRAMILVYLVLETEQFTEYDAHYFPDAEIAITRLSEPKNYGLASLPGRTVLCAELPCFLQDPVWQADDAELGHLVAAALASAGIPVRVPIIQTVSRRLPQAYPLYTNDYRDSFKQIDLWLQGVDGILTFGRQGLFAHDNTHHALAMSYAVDKCLDNSGNLNRERWQEYRQAFEKHVVED
jgi:protoporphyrinogen oxidase